jgi:hypothetical protein
MDLNRNMKIVRFTMIFAVAICLLPSITQAFSTPESWYFGDVEMGSTSRATMTISTSSTENIILTALRLQNGAEFKVVTEVPQQGIVVPPNQAVRIEIAYTPTIVDTVTDTLYIHTNNPFIGRGIIQLSGTGYSSKIEFGDILEFFDTAVAAGSLQGDEGEKSSDYFSDNKSSLTQKVKKAGKDDRSADNRLKAFRNMIKSVDNMVQDENITGACEQMIDVYRKTDGQSPQDFVAGVAKEDLAEMIVAYSKQLDCK